MKLKRYFQGVEPGDTCTGTIHFFKLDAQQLIRRKVVKQEGRDYVFLGLPKEQEVG